MDPIATANLKLSLNKGTARLWLEGAKLAAAGFIRGDNYKLDFFRRKDGTFGVLINLEAAFGERDGKVAGRERNGKALPIIDRHVSQWTALIGTHRLAVQYFPGMVVITPERIN